MANVAGEADGANTSKFVYQIDAFSLVFARIGRAFVNVNLADFTCKRAGNQSTGEVVVNIITVFGRKFRPQCGNG